MKFTKATFKYFDMARKNSNSREWFDKNKGLYEEAVKKPLQALLIELNKKYQRQLPRIQIGPDKISRPLRPKNRAEDGGLVKNNVHFSLAEKRTSLFEWNPGIYFQMGADKDDNFFGLGLYMTSSRQTSLLRNALVEDFDRIDEILSDRRLKKTWGGLKGDVYKRFPKGFNPDSEAAKYLKYKQFYLGKNYTRAEIISPKFASQLMKDLGVALDFFAWIRGTVGTYSR
tara:strand:- start:19694 stop:20377 length:684 start_codon:yes stop_codon:yes gene_type:complete